MSTQKTNKSGTITTLLLHYIKTHKWSAFFYLFFAFFWAFTLPYMSYLLGDIIDRIKSHGLESIPFSELVFVPLCLYVSIHVLRSVGYFLSGLCSIYSIIDFKASLIKKVFSHLSQLSSHFYETNKSGAVSQKITNTMIGIEPIIYNLASQIFPQSLAILITGIMLSLVVPYFGIVLWVWGIVVTVFTFYSAKIGEKKASKFAASCSIFNGHVIDLMTNIPIVIHNATFKQESKLFDKNLKEMIAKERIRNHHANRLSFIQFLAMNALVAFYLIGSVIGYQHHLLSIGDLVFVMTAVTSIASLTCSLGNSFLQLIYHVGLVKEGLAILDNEIEIPEKTHAKPHLIKKSSIEIKDISFAYENRANTFTKFNLSIPAKQKLGIVGQSGAGKTTLVKLLMRLYNLNAGSIEIDGVNINDYPKTSLHKQIAYVSQHLNMFHRSIKDNIAYGCWDVTEKDIIEAAKKAHCHDFITELEMGYDTIIGEQGTRLSGGQRQRIAIARAILKNPPIVLFDEATSALDSRTEKAIQEALDTLLENKTAIIVAHRLSTLKSMDRIVVLDKGAIIEEGKHSELLKLKGAYHSYWTYQSDGFIE